VGGRPESDLLLERRLAGLAPAGRSLYAPRDFDLTPVPSPFREGGRKDTSPFFLPSLIGEGGVSPGEVKVKARMTVVLSFALC